uniref:NADH dehydrogenase subunit 6 n=1 Tax=Parapsyche elsis TaxID=177890 RepID=UPI002237D447|nr:NADH dehydrogenase subunit 6 [Parapsyche elsis]UYO79354.1 NADH dehydrogenase subunit 6 [Parapsyche elsis]
MIKSLTLLFLLSNSLMMLFLSTPLSLGALILIQTLLTCVLINLTLNMYWISYIFYLIMLGGLLILFMYMCSIASNELISLQLPMMIYFITTLITMYVYTIYSPHLPTPMSAEPSLTDTNLIMINENKLICNKMYNSYTFNLTLIIIIYLLISLSVVTKLTNSSNGPLRANK